MKLCGEKSRSCAPKARTSPARKGPGIFTPRLPAPRMPATATTAAEELAGATNSLYNRLKDSAVKLTSAQTETYLQENGRTAASLLAAFRCSGDVSFLEEAKQSFPNDPQVAFEAAFRTNIPPEERHRVETLERSDPDNPLPNYISAVDHFRYGQTDLARQATGCRVRQTEVQRLHTRPLPE